METVTPSGLRYKVLQAGKGREPVRNQRVSVHYTGWFDDNGKKFDSSLDHGKPFEFPVGVGCVISGWDEAILGMKPGEKRLLIIPPHLGYGVLGMPGRIPGNATLRFEVELLKVLP